MPKLKSSKKRLIVNQTQRPRNRAHMSAMRSAITAVDAASDVESAQTALKTAISVIDKTARKGIVHRNTAARDKSRLTKHVNSMA